MTTALRKLTVVVMTAAVFSACRSSSTGPTPAGRPAQILVVSGADQTVPVGTIPANSPVFVVRDSDGRPVANIPVRFVVNQGNGTLTAGDSVNSGPDGRVTLSGWRRYGRAAVRAGTGYRRAH
jgi:hypothetical protein